MRITAKISHYRKGVLAFFLAPFLWVQMYFHALEAWLTQIIYDEIFNREDDKYAQSTHILAFLCFSGFCFLAYYKNLDQYIALILYGFWLINYFSAKFKTGLYVDKPAWVRLELKEDCWQWTLVAKNQQQETHRFNYSDIHRVLISVVTYGDDSFRNQVLQTWHVLIETHNQQRWEVYQADDIQTALRLGVELAEKLNTKVTINESYGIGKFADVHMEQNYQQIITGWDKNYVGNQVEIYKSFSTMSILRWLRLIFQQVSDFLFIAILAGVMERYGTLLMFMFWDDLGLPPPSNIHIEISFQSLLSFFSPDFDWVLQIVFIVTFIVLLCSIYKQSLKHQLFIDSEKVEYIVSGKVKGNLHFNTTPDIIVLKGFDKTSLIIVNEQYKVLEITDLEDDEYDELYEMLLTI